MPTIISTRIRAVGHEKESVALAERFLRRLTNERQLIRIVLELTELHMRPNAAAAEHASIKATNRMFDRTQAPEALLALAAADDRGRITERPQAENEKTLRQRLATYRETRARPYVTGEDLLRAGLEPGPEFSDWLAYAHKLRLAGIGKEDALKQTLGYAGKNRKQSGGCAVSGASERESTGRVLFGPDRCFGLRGNVGSQRRARTCSLGMKPTA